MTPSDLEKIFQQMPHRITNVDIIALIATIIDGYDLQDDFPRVMEGVAEALLTMHDEPCDCEMCVARREGMH
jgi:hypothetical protein|tara:strand:+ start:98 stop:313 length:216 start_codon:yes stop_codon:yes gene_type:complete